MRKNPTVAAAVVAVFFLSPILWPLDGAGASQTNWSIETIDAADAVGRYNSIALDSSGYPHISYREGRYDDLKYARWTGNDWHIEIVDSEGDVGVSTSIALDSLDNPHISYRRVAADLKYARWTGNSWEIQTVYSEARTGSLTSIALDSSDRPHISYFNSDNLDLMYARWTGSSWETQTVDSEGSVGWGTVMALDSSDCPHIIYTEEIYTGEPPLNYDSNLKYARWTGSSWEIQTVGSEGRGLKDLVLDSFDCPHISYSSAKNDLMYARWTGSSWEIQIVDSEVDIVWDVSIALDSSGYPHISYSTNENLKYARWTGSSWEIQIVDTNLGVYGTWESIAIGPSDVVHISYMDEINDDLKYARLKTINIPPAASFTYSPTSPTIDNLIQFTDRSTDPDGTIVSWLWDFGDGSADNSQNPTHRYSSAGTYTVTLTVTDNGGAAGSSSKNITVSAHENVRTVLTLSPPSFSLFGGEPLTLTATLVDNAGDPVAGKTITWSATVGDLSAPASETDSSGRASVTYTAPSVTASTEVTITASFAGDTVFLASENAAAGVVSPPFPTTLTITPSGFSIFGGEPLTLTATLTDDTGNPVAGKTIAWSATVGDLSAPASETDSSGRASVTLTAPTVAENTPVTVTASFAGDTSHEASENSVAGTVLPPIPASLALSPSSFSLRPGTSRTLTATLTSDGAPVTGRTVTWEASAGTLSATSGTTDSSGRASVTYTAPDYETTAAVTASFAGDGRYGADNAVTLATIARGAPTLTITPSTFTLQPGDSTTLTATLTCDGAPLIGRTLTWSATAGEVVPSTGTTDSMGQLTVTYTAPDSETDVTVTAFFAGDDQYLAGAGSSLGKIKAAPPIQAVIDLKPETLRIGAEGVWVTCYIELPEDNVGRIDVSSIRLEGIVEVDPDAPTEIGDYDNDNIQDLMVKFDRASVENLVSPGIVTLTVTGEVDGATFAGSDTMDVIEPGPRAVASFRRRGAGEPLESRHETYDENLILEVEAVEGEVLVRVDSKSGVGATVAVNVDRDVVEFSGLDELEVRVDGERIGLADDYEDVVEADENDPEYLALVGGEGVQVLVSIPHFSTRTITIGRAAAEVQPSETAPTSPQPSAGISPLATITIVALVAALLLIIWKYRSVRAERVAVEEMLRKG
jgi:PKD repeat protein